jgi:hypothetical protein
MTPLALPYPTGVASALPSALAGPASARTIRAPQPASRGALSFLALLLVRDRQLAIVAAVGTLSVLCGGLFNKNRSH